jgi:hypothetical protein
MAAADEGADWSLVNFAKQVFGAKSAPPEVSFNFVEPPPAEPEPVAKAEETEPTAVPETELAAVPETESTPAPETEPTAAPESDPEPKPDQTADAQEPTKADETPVMAVAEAQAPPPVEATPFASEGKRQLRTAGELADIILNALRAVDGVPERGFVITVYGSRPWNAMLTIKPEAGRIKDVQLWRQRVQDIGARLRRDFDLIDEG